MRDKDADRGQQAEYLSGGLLIFVRITDRVTVVPELRYTHSLVRDDPYRVFRMGVRAILSF
jgi:hypothetical protein